jgi:hypothetical protein
VARAFDDHVQAVLNALQCKPTDVILAVNRTGGWIAFCHGRRNVRTDLDEPTAHALLALGAKLDAS